MPTVNLGRVKPIFKGAYNTGTAYKPLDFVVFSSITYFCIANTTGNAPPNATYWQPLFVQEIDTSLYPYLPQNKTPSQWVALLSVATGEVPLATNTLSLDFSLGNYLIQE